MDQKDQKNKDMRLHVLFFTSALGGGGAEMNLLRIMNNLNREKFRVSLALTRRGGRYETMLVNDIQINYLPTGIINSSTLRMIRSIIPLCRLIQDESPDIVCSVMDHANSVALIAVSRLEYRPRIILCVQMPPSIHYKRSWHPIDHLILFSIGKLYNYSDCIVSLSRGVCEDLLLINPGIRGKIEVIYNAGVDNILLEKVNERINDHEYNMTNPLIVACGRLTEQKGFSCLIDAFSYLRRTVPAHLWIIGEGEQRHLLQLKIRGLGLENSVWLLGFQENPFKYMAAADVFVLSSLWEGFGNVIVEAMACGTPVVATDCPYGPAEIITDGENGLLVPPGDPEALAESIRRILQDAALRAKLVECGHRRAMDFSVSTITQAYERLFEAVHGQSYNSFQNRT